MNSILRRQGKPAVSKESASLRETGFRSLDFAELAVRVEEHLHKELAFDATRLRAILTVGDVLDFFSNL